MSIPTRPEQAFVSIQSASNNTGVYEVTLMDGTILWVPIDSGNNDYVHVKAWADEENIEL